MFFLKNELTAILSMYPPSLDCCIEIPQHSPLRPFPVFVANLLKIKWGCKIDISREKYISNNKIYRTKGALNYGIKKGGRTPGSTRGWMSMHPSPLIFASNLSGPFCRPVFLPCLGANGGYNFILCQ